MTWRMFLNGPLGGDDYKDDGNDDMEDVVEWPSGRVRRMMARMS